MRLRDQGRWWGTSEAERLRPYPCDALLPAANAAWHRGVTVRATPEVVFRWLCQLRAAPYSYDWIDNLGRRSPRALTPGLDALAPGQRFMTIFELASFEPGVHVTLRLSRAGLFPPMAVSYLVAPGDDGTCRLLAKVALALRPGLCDRLVAALGPWLDAFMMRRQLLNLAARAEGRG